MEKYLGLAPCAGATISVYNHGTLDLVDLFQDAVGTVVQANPFTADARTGLYRFYAPLGDYDIQIRTANIPAALRVPDAQLYVVAAGVTPNRFVSLVVDDGSEQIVVVQQVY